jgi:HEPN domain-containing protein
MNETVREWLRKAERDFATARREIAVTLDPNYDGVCFHAQQGVEKLLKAVLINLGVRPDRTHDLNHLGTALHGLSPTWTWPEEELIYLSRASVEYRYPGEEATDGDARQSLDIAERLRTALLPLLPSGALFDRENP